jgi:L-rhamnose mutarotase
VKRVGQVIKVRPEKLEEYKRLHAAVWPEVLEATRERHLRNYSIFYKDGYLFAYFEYVGDDYESDMKALDADERCQKWEGVCRACHGPLETRAEGEWWADMEEVFHCD